MDVVTAFLNANVTTGIYMEQLEGYHVPSSSGTRLVCKLDKALYGIREAPRSRLECPFHIMAHLLRLHLVFR